MWTPESIPAVRKRSQMPPQGWGQFRDSAGALHYQDKCPFLHGNLESQMQVAEPRVAEWGRSPHCVQTCSKSHCLSSGPLNQPGPGPTANYCPEHYQFNNIAWWMPLVGDPHGQTHAPASGSTHSRAPLNPSSAEDARNGTPLP